ncbi:MAG: DUF433 domain-containing protein [Actinobacteria bacterium]|nr:DUF433 domain-containing protein [Actinomycetota bacterium]
MAPLDRITRSIDVMGGKPCVGRTRVTIGTVVGLVAAGTSIAEILDAYPYLDEQDAMQALACAAWRVEEIESPMPPTARSSSRRTATGRSSSPRTWASAPHSLSGAWRHRA